MQLKKLVDQIARFSHMQRMESDYGEVPADNELQIINSLHYQITKYYPNTKKYLDRYSQKISYQITKTYSVDGDKMNEYGVIIKMTEAFIKKFTDEYPEGLI